VGQSGSRTPTTIPQGGGLGIYVMKSDVDLACASDARVTWC